LNVGAKWKDIGSVTYGFLVQVYNPEVEVTNNVSTGEKTAGFEVFVAIMALLLTISIRRNRRKRT